jgi:hypothetical protein
VLIRYNNLAGLYQSKIQKMDVVIEQYRQTSEIPAPQEIGFVFTPQKGGTEGKK